MINKIAFTGRETMLTDGLQKASQKTQEFISSSSILPALPKTKPVKPVISEAVYTSPFAPTGSSAAAEFAEKAPAPSKLDLYI